jgi:hypothetical protein
MMEAAAFRSPGAACILYALLRFLTGVTCCTLKCWATPFTRSDLVTAGAPHLSVGSGKVYFEVEICRADGEVLVGWRGVNSAAVWIGKDVLSWAIYKQGRPYFRQECTHVSLSRATV